MPQVPDLNALTLADLDAVLPLVEALLTVLPATGVIVIDCQRRIRVAQGDVFARHGHDVRAIPGRDVADVLPAEVWQRSRVLWEGALAGRAIHTDWRSATGGGQDYWTHFVPVVTTDGQVVGAMMVAQEISERVNAQRALERHVAQQAAVSRLGSMALAGAGLQEVLDAAVTALIEVLGADIGNVVEDLPGAAMRLRAISGEGLPPLPTSATERAAVFEHVRATGRPLLLADLRLSPELRSPGLESIGMTSLVAAPITPGGRQFGLLGACSRNPAAFTERDLDFVQALANVIAETIDRDRAADRVRRELAERHRHEEELRRREAMLQQAERLAGGGSWDIDFTTGRHTVSEHLREMLLLPSTETSAAELFGRVHPEDRDAVRGAIAAQRAASFGGPLEFRVLLPDGTERVYAGHTELVWGEGRLPVGLRGTIQDVTDRRAAERQLQFSEERFRQGFDHAPIAMTLIDATTSRYLRVNDAFCTMVGRTRDELLVGLTFRDVLHPEDLVEVEARLERESSRDPMVLEQRYVRPDGSVVWGSVHVSPVLGHNGRLDALFTQIVDVTDRHAQEDALRRQLEEVSWIGEIRAALVEDRFELFAQPIVDLASGETRHHELLLRMRDAEGQLVAPDMFLPTAERYGDIRDIDRWVVGRAMEYAAQGMSVAINLSGTSLGDPGLIEHIDAELERTGAPPQHLVFEITETALVHSSETATLLGDRLRERGCRFALDDFGTGYGGFHYLKTLPLDILKIDREFVRDSVSSESDRHLIWAVVNLAHNFGLRTIAEGIEDAATVQLLTEMGVDEGQGYHLGRPAPITEADLR
jgi:PAS domain S-box-containing protein